MKLNRSLADLEGAVAKASAGHKQSISALVGLFEDPRPNAASLRARVLEQLSSTPSAPIVGLTGTPGAGKSSLVARLSVELLEADSNLSIAVVAVDPSSQVSGGSLLGDRTRMRPNRHGERLFFRSQAAAHDLGGLAPSTFQVCRLLSKLFSVVVVETVGIGQSESDVRLLADRVYLVMQPLGGDEVQFLKAGIIEVPDVFVVNKCDDEAATATVHRLRASLGLARPFDDERPPLIVTSALTGVGLDELGADIIAHIDRLDATRDQVRELHFFSRWVDDEWGRRGTSHLDTHFGGAEAFLATQPDFDLAQMSFNDSIYQSMTPLSAASKQAGIIG